MGEILALILSPIISYYVLTRWLIPIPFRIRARKAEERVQEISSRDLEESLRQRIKDPAEYDALWERIERYKAQGGVKCEHYPKLWKIVGNGRLPVFAPDGTLKTRSEAVNERLEQNREYMLTLLVHTYDLHTDKQARELVWRGLDKWTQSILRTKKEWWNAAYGI